MGCLRLQELIIQNFQPKKGTAMAGCQPPSLEEMLWTIAAARLIFGPTMNIQAPPNLAPGTSLSPEQGLMFQCVHGFFARIFPYHRGRTRKR